MIISSLQTVLNKINSKSWTSFVFWYLSFFVLAIAVRLPHFLSNVFWFDGDEAIVGIMAQDILSGKNFSLYFYGQAYGLTIFESLSVAFWIKLIGTGIWALRLGALTVFTLGILFLFKGLIARGRSQKFAFLFSMAILCFPTWMIWGALARGGYVTAFAASFLLYYLISLKNYSVRNIVLIALSLTIIFDAHNLLLFVLAPLLLRDWLVNKGSWQKLIVGIGISAGFYFILHSTVVDNGSMYTPWMDYTLAEFSNRWKLYFDGFINSFGGFYYLGYLFPIPEWWKWLMVFSLVIILFLIIRLFIMVEKKDKNYISLWFLGMLGILFICAFPVGYSARYLISFFTGFVFLFAFFDSFLTTSKLNSILGVLLLLIFIGGIGAGSKQHRDWYVTNVNCMDALENLHKEAQKNNLKALYTSDFMLQWQWNYLYGNEIPVNPFGNVERINRFVEKSDSIYQKSPEKVGIIGNWGIFMGLDTLEGYQETLIQIHEKYYLQTKMNPVYHEFGFKQRGVEYVPTKLDN